MSVANLGHAQRVRLLYKTILRLHRSLPEDFKVLGDSYTREEFRRHKSASSVQAMAFMEAWTNYALTISRQLGSRRGISDLGQPFNADDLNQFSEEQLVQLFELYQESTRAPEA